MIYFDNAATGWPKSESAFAAMRSAYFGSGNAGRSGHDLANEGARIIYSCRKSAGALFGCEPEYTVLTKNATEAINLAIKGVIRRHTLKKNKSEVLISSLEHNSVLRPVHALCKNHGLKLRQFEVNLHDDDKTVNNFSEAINKNTVLAVCIHASNVFGRILPIKQLAALSAKHSVTFILDAAQTTGYFPFTIKELGVDIMCTSGHKGLYGPTGTGFMLVNAERTINFDTIMEGGTGIGSFEREMPSFLPERLEYGTQNTCGYAGLAAACEELDYPGEKLSTLFAYLLEKLRQRDDIILYGTPENNTGDYVPVLLLNKKNVTSEEVAFALNEKGIAVRAGYHCAPLAHAALGTIKNGGVRISLGRSNTTQEIDYLLDVL